MRCYSATHLHRETLDKNLQNSRRENWNQTLEKITSYNLFSSRKPNERPPNWIAFSEILSDTFVALLTGSSTSLPPAAASRDSLNTNQRRRFFQATSPPFFRRPFSAYILIPSPLLWHHISAHFSNWLHFVRLSFVSFFVAFLSSSSQHKKFIWNFECLQCALILLWFLNLEEQLNSRHPQRIFQQTPMWLLDLITQHENNKHHCNIMSIV